MLPQLDHIILNVNNLAESIDFYAGVLGFTYEGARAGTPFSVIRLTADFMLQLAPFGTKGGEHLAFSMSGDEFERVFQRVRDRAIEYGDSFDTVGNMRGPGDSEGARGQWKAVYFFDPSKHLIEIAHYEIEA
jgi:catechol 2,3-dioxygenase-like lactoylglutathione lyase family enzyme